MTAKKRVLIVDDEPAVGTLLAMCCEFWGLEPLVAHNGGEALRLVEEQAPDLIVTDYMMPGMTGHEVCRRARTNGRRDIPIIMMSAAPDAARRECAADALLAKPLDLDEVERTIREFLEPGEAPDRL